VSRRAILREGPYDGFVDTIKTGEWPEVVTIAWCEGCKRNHLHSVIDWKTGGDTPLYLLDRSSIERPAAVPVVYRYMDLDGGLDAITTDAAAQEPQVVGVVAITAR
jgi:hypothetical protein